MNDKFKVGDKIRITVGRLTKGLTGVITSTDHGFSGVAEYYRFSLDEPLIIPSGVTFHHDLGRSVNEIEHI